MRDARGKGQELLEMMDTQLKVKSSTERIFFIPGDRIWIKREMETRKAACDNLLANVSS